MHWQVQAEHLVILGSHAELFSTWTRSKDVRLVLIVKFGSIDEELLTCTSYISLSPVDLSISTQQFS